MVLAIAIASAWSAPVSVTLARCSERKALREEV
jgi:hypothetical protein